MALVVWTLAALLCLALPASAEPMKWCPVTATDSLAVCNDGSPAGYYYRPGSGTTANKCVGPAYAFRQCHVLLVHSQPAWSP